MVRLNLGKKFTIVRIANGSFAAFDAAIVVAA